MYTDDISQLLALVLNMKVKKSIDRDGLQKIISCVSTVKKQIAEKASKLIISNPVSTGPKTKGRPQDIVFLEFSDGYGITTSGDTWMINLGGRSWFYSSLAELLSRLFEKKLMQVVRGPDVDSLLRDIDNVKNNILEALASPHGA